MCIMMNKKTNWTSAFLMMLSVFGVVEVGCAATETTLSFKSDTTAEKTAEVSEVLQYILQALNGWVPSGTKVRATNSSYWNTNRLRRILSWKGKKNDLQNALSKIIEFTYGEGYNTYFGMARKLLGGTVGNDDQNKNRKLATEIVKLLDAMDLGTIPTKDNLKEIIAHLIKDFSKKETGSPARYNQYNQRNALNSANTKLMDLLKEVGINIEEVGIKINAKETQQAPEETPSSN
jgi:hypothetical protein